MTRPVLRLRSPLLGLTALGLGLLIPCLYALQLGDLRQHTVGFLVAFFVACGLYGAATALVLRPKAWSNRAIVAVFALAVAAQIALLFTRPALSDDMYRYLWDGRVQAQGISPYRYPPDAPELRHLRDEAVWRNINRKDAITVYPPAAEMAFAVLWRIRPDSVRWFQAAMASGALLAGGLLIGLLRDLGRSKARVLIYLWAPLLAFETAHAAHVDGLVLPLLVGAWWARVRERDGLVGVLLGLAAAIKIYPILLLPALWRPQHKQGRWQMPAAFAATVVACYLPYVISSQSLVLGYLPNYFQESFNVGLIRLFTPAFHRLGTSPQQAIPLLMTGAWAATSLMIVLRPAPDGETALRRCIWPIGLFTLVTQNLFSWYMLWLLPLCAIFVQPGRLLGLRANGWTGWWLFCGLVALSYTFFLRWRPVPAAIWAQYLPLYLFLLKELVVWVKNRKPQNPRLCLS